MSKQRRPLPDARRYDALDKASRITTHRNVYHSEKNLAVSISARLDAIAQAFKCVAKCVKHVIYNLT